MTYRLRPKLATVGLGNRQYSTYDVKSSNTDVVANNLFKSPIIFSSLDQACEEIKFKYIGVSGVYKLINKNDLSRFYIGSSNNLARRMEEYNKLTKCLRKPQSAGELEISKTPSSNWILEFIHITTPQLSLIFDQGPKGARLLFLNQLLIAILK